MRKRDNLIAVRAVEGSALEAVLAEQKAKGEGMKNVLHTWAERDRTLRAQGSTQSGEG